MCRRCAKHNVEIYCPGCGKYHRVHLHAGKRRTLRGLIGGRIVRGLSHASAKDTHNILLGARRFSHRQGRQTTVNIAGVDLPVIILVPAVIVFFILIGIILLLFFKRGSTTGSPLEQRMALVIPVDEHESMGVGKLLTGVQRTENKILVPDPDIIDNQGQPKTFSVDITGIQGVKFLDAVKNIIELHLIFDRGEWVAQSFAALLKNVKRRWDPLEADPQDIGDFYVGWGFLRKAFNQLLQSTTGKILVFGAVGLIGYLLGMFTIAAHVGHL